MNKSEIFKAAHKLARTFEGNYKACFVLALKEIRQGLVVPVTLVQPEKVEEVKEWEAYGKSKRVYFKVRKGLWSAEKFMFSCETGNFFSSMGTLLTDRNTPSCLTSEIKDFFMKKFYKSGTIVKTIWVATEEEVLKTNVIM